MVLPESVHPEPDRIVGEVVSVEVPVSAYFEVPYRVKPGQAIVPEVVAEEDQK